MLCGFLRGSNYFVWYLLGVFSAVLLACEHLDLPLSKVGKFLLNPLSSDVCMNGIPLYINSYLCRFGYAKISCEPVDFNPALKSLPWKTMILHTKPHHKVVGEEQMLENQFVVISTGVKFTNTQLNYLPDERNRSRNIYRFIFEPAKRGSKSRLELSTCFVSQKKLLELFGSPILNPTLGTSLITYCAEVNTPIKAIHDYKFEMYFPFNSFPTKGRFFICQWHGSPDPNVIIDKHGLVKKLSNLERDQMCSSTLCEQGQVFNANGHPTDVKYQHGGYPPLGLAVMDGMLVLIARSDARMFIAKAGCPLEKLVFTNHTCHDHPGQQCHLLWRLPIEEFSYDKWITFNWSIKWSEYVSIDETDTLEDKQRALLTNAWIRFFMDGVQVLEWKGPCGRNDNKRVPFFKAGVYNPKGSTDSFTYYMRSYEHTYREHSLLSDFEKETLKDLLL